MRELQLDHPREFPLDEKLHVSLSAEVDALHQVTAVTRKLGRCSSSYFDKANTKQGEMSKMEVSRFSPLTSISSRSR